MYLSSISTSTCPSNEVQPKEWNYICTTNPLDPQCSITELMELVELYFSFEQTPDLLLPEIRNFGINFLGSCLKNPSLFVCRNTLNSFCSSKCSDSENSVFCFICPFILGPKYIQNNKKDEL